MLEVANCYTVCDDLLGKNVDYRFKARIWNGSDPDHIVGVHVSDVLPLVFVICYRCCWIVMHCLPKPKCRVGIRVWWHTKIQAKDGWRRLRLLKAYDEGSMLPFDVVEIWHPEVPKPYLLINWYLSSPAMCWIL